MHAVGMAAKLDEYAVLTLMLCPEKRKKQPTRLGNQYARAAKCLRPAIQWIRMRILSPGREISIYSVNIRLSKLNVE